MGASCSRERWEAQSSSRGAALLERAKVTLRSEPREQGEEQGPRRPGYSLETARLENGELSYTVLDDCKTQDRSRGDSAGSTDGGRDREVCFVSDPEAPVKTASNSLLKLSKTHDEVIIVEFDFLLSRTSVHDAKSLSLACAKSPQDLGRMLEERKRGNLQRHPALTVIETVPDQSGRLSFVWSPSLSALSSNSQLSSTSSPHLVRWAGKRYCALLSYQPNTDSFATLASFSVWLESQPPKRQNSVSTPQLIASLTSYTPAPVPISDGNLVSHQMAGPPATDYLSPQPHYPSTSPNPRRSSFQLEANNKRLSYQSESRSAYSGSPAPSSDGLYYSPQQHSVPLPPGAAVAPHARSSSRPPPRRSATSPNLSQPQDLLSTSPSGVSPTATPDLPRPALHLPSNVTNPASTPQLEEIGDMPDDDGPLFRAHLKAMEERAYYLRRNLKGLIKASEGVVSSLRILDDSEYAFDLALRELAVSNPNAVQSLNDTYWQLARQIQGFARKEGVVRMEDLVIDPLKRIVVILKAAETKKKTFDQENKAYYDHVNRYLTVKNDSTSHEARLRAMAADEKHKAKKDRFLIARLDYFNSLRDLALFKECATLATLTHYAHSTHDIAVASGKDLDGSSLALTDLDLRIDALSAEIEERRTQIEMTRRAMETRVASERPDMIGAQKIYHVSRTSVDSAMLLGQHLSPTHAQDGRQVDTGAGEVLGISPSPEVPHNGRAQWLDLPSARHEAASPPSDEGIGGAQLRKKEGFLWANSRPVTHQASLDHVKHWQKYWVVLSGGQLCEYADDRLELHSTPINLRFATVREAKMQDRRFTFEVITPSLRRVYQATSAEEAQAWHKTIANVIQSLLDGTSSVRHFVRQQGSDGAIITQHGLGINTGAPKQDQSALSASNGYARQATATSASTASDGFQGVLARLNKPLQRRASGKHSKRESVTNFVSNIAAAANVRRREREHTGSNQLATLLEASQSMTSFFAQDPKAANPVAHPKSASSHLGGSPSQHSNQLASPEGPRSAPANSADDLDRSIEAAVNSAFGPVKPAKQSRESKESNARELQILLKLPDNRRCADCNDRDPRWASWNLGIFICIRCSGLHRGLGSHISKVRSIDLDDWSDEQLESMKNIGNKTARLTWEPPDLPPESRSSENIAQLIKMKYVERRWRGST